MWLERCVSLLGIQIFAFAGPNWKRSHFQPPPQHKHLGLRCNMFVCVCFLSHWEPWWLSLRLPTFDSVSWRGVVCSVSFGGRKSSKKPRPLHTRHISTQRGATFSVDYLSLTLLSPRRDPGDQTGTHGWCISLIPNQECQQMLAMLWLCFVSQNIKKIYQFMVLSKILNKYTKRYD